MYKYIIIDDESIIRKGILKKSQSFPGELKFAGEADNGEDALALIQDTDPDIILTDMNMPTMDGPKLLKILQKNYPSKKIIVISGYTDFEYMKEAISAKAVTYLAKPFSIDELHNAFSKAISFIEEENSIKEKIISYEAAHETNLYQRDLDLLYGIIRGTHNKKELMFQSEALRHLSKCKYISLIAIYSNAPINNELLSDVMKKHNLEIKSVYFPNELNNQMMFIIFFHSHTNINLMKEETRNLIKQCYEASSHNFYSGASSYKMSLSALGQAYKESIYALNSRKISNNSSYCCYFFEDSPSVQSNLDWEKLDELLFFIENGNTDQVTLLLEEFFSFYTTSDTSTIYELKLGCNSIIIEAKNILNRYFETASSTSLSSSSETIIDTLFDINELREYITLLISNITDALQANNIYSNQNTVDNIKLYIENNYNKILTLEKMSSLFFINPSYCSALFKEKVGANFIDYVNQVRIEKGKDLLRNTDYKVYKIAKILGYDNPKYFFRVFKKITGATPEQYRKNG